MLDVGVYSRYYHGIYHSLILVLILSEYFRTVTMAIVAQDSTTAYYDIHDGMKKPGELEVNDELLVASD
jgi:hypothetical protein